MKWFIIISFLATFSAVFLIIVLGHMSVTYKESIDYPRWILYLVDILSVIFIGSCLTLCFMLPNYM